MMRMILLACAATALAAAPAAAQSGRARNAPAPVTVPAPPEGMGQVVFFRPSGQGFLLGCTVHEGESEVGRLGNGKYFVHPTTPGAHEYRVQSEATDRLNLEVEAGETEYVRCSIGMGIMVGRPNLSPATDTEFATASRRLRPQRQRGEGERSGGERRGSN